MADLLLRSSSSRRETKSENRKMPKKIGCMSGIFHLLNNHHLTRKRLTSHSGKKDKKVNSPKKLKPLAGNPDDAKETTKMTTPPEKTPSVPDLRRISCDVPRSPTLPPEIRRSNSVKTPENFRRTPALVARLMGLEEIPSPSPQSSAEKRRKLLGALEKCDKDLKALKKIIEAIRMAEDRRKSVAETRRKSFGGSVMEPRTNSLGDSVTRARDEETDRLESLHEYVLGSHYKGRAGLGDLDGRDSMIEEKRCSDVNAEQPSPVSVLDEISSSPLERKSHTPEKGGRYLLKDDINGSFFLNRRFSGREGGDPNEYLSSPVKTTKRRLISTGSKAMVETINEVWKNGIWEEAWELGRIGVVLEGDILGELVEEIVEELGCYCKCSHALDTCKKRLCF